MRAPQAISTHHSRPLRANEARFVCESADFRATNDGLVYVLKGKLRVTVGDATEVVTGGDAFRQLAGKPYGVVALDDTSYIAMDLPPRALRRCRRFLSIRGRISRRALATC